MPLADNTWNDGANDQDFGNPLNWSNAHVPTSSERAVINVDGSFIFNGPYHNTAGPLIVGEILFTAGGDNDYDLHDVKCLGTLAGSNAGRIKLADVGDANGPDWAFDLIIVNFTGNITDIGQSDLRIEGGNGTVRFFFQLCGAFISTAFRGTLIADDVEVNLNDSILSRAVTLTTLGNGAFVNYTRAEGGSPSGLNLGLTMGL